MNAFRLFFVSLVVAVLSCGCSRDSPTNASTSILALNWYPEAEHGGFLAAAERGYFQDNGVDVQVRPGSKGAPSLVIQELATGRIQFAVSNADLVVLNRAAGVPLVAIAAPLQQSPRCILVHESSGFQSLADLANIELAISDSRPFAVWMQKQLPLNNVTLVPFSGSVGEFLQKKNFAQQAYVFSEPFLAQENDSDPQTLMLSDIGFNPYSSLLVTTEEQIQKHPETVRAIVQASVKGWDSYLKDPVAVNRSINAENRDMSMEALAFGADSLIELCRPKADETFCGMTEERWAELIAQIEEIGEIDEGVVKAADCFTNEFLPKTR